jgi:phenylacetic acid degradation operon negative regulatory protein
VRPNNLTPGIEGIRNELCALGLDPEAPVFRMERLSSADERRARAMWDSAALEQSYSRLHRDIDLATIRLAKLPLNDALREVFLLGREGIRQVVLDPLLPAPLIDEDERSAMVGALQDYCDRGLDLWARFLELGDSTGVVKRGSSSMLTPA